MTDDIILSLISLGKLFIACGFVSYIVNKSKMIKSIKISKKGFDIKFR